MKNIKLLKGKAQDVILKNKKLLIGGGALTVCLIGLAGLTFIDKGAKEEPGNQVLETYVIPTQKKVVINGTVVPSQVMSYVKDLTKGEEVTLNIVEGQVVKEGDLLLTYHNKELTEQIKDLKEDLSELNIKKSKLAQEGTSTAKSINKQIKVIDEQKTNLKQETQSQVNKVLKQLDELAKQKTQLNPEDENYEVLVAEVEMQIENCYVQKNDLEYNLPKQMNELDEQIIDLREQLSEADEDTFTALNDQIKEISKQISKLEEKEFSYEYAPFSGNVSLVEEVASETQKLMTLKSSDFYVSGSVSEKDYMKLSVGMEAQTLILATNNSIDGAITYIGQDPLVSETPGATYPLKVSLIDQSHLVNGYQAQITMKLTDALIKVPTSAIVTEGTNHYVYLVTENGEMKQTIETLGVEGEFTTIKSGLNEKDEILIYPNVEMKEGERIE